MQRYQPNPAGPDLVLNQPREPIFVGCILALNEGAGMALAALFPKNGEKPRVDSAPDDDPRLMRDVPAD
jgi:hypothetical protein